MNEHQKLLVHVFDIKRLVDARMKADLDRLAQLDKLAAWYEGINPLPPLYELAQHQLKQRVEASALEAFSPAEYEAFRAQWWKLSPHEQRSFLCELAGMPPPQHRDTR